MHRPPPPATAQSRPGVPLEDHDTPIDLRLSVVVPATDSPPTLDRCLEAIRSADQPPDEVIVVDSPAGDGPAAARNAGVERASGQVIVFVDSDVLVHRDAFTRIRERFAADPELDAAFGSYDASPGARQIPSVFRNMLHHWVHQGSAGRVRTFWAGLGAVRRAAFTAVGGFDADRYPEPAVEDVELGGRLAQNGAIELDPGLQGTHLKRWTVPGMVRTDLLSRGRPLVALMLDRDGASVPLNLKGRHLASTASSLGALALLVLGLPLAAAALACAFLAVNAPLYALILRHRGPAAMLAAPLLHVLHILVTLVAAPIGVVAFLLPARRPAPAIAARAKPERSS